MLQWQPVLVWVLTLGLAMPPADEKAIQVDGLVRLIEHVDVSARRDGKIDQFAIKEGSYVRRHDVLARLDDKEASLQLTRVELEHQLAKEKANSTVALDLAQLIQHSSRNEFQRAAQAKQAAPNSISTTEFERLKLDAEKAVVEVARLTEEKRFASITAQSKAVEVELCRLALSERQIVSPLDGMVVQLHRREGEWVHLGEKVVRIVRIDRLRVEAYVNLHSGLAALEKAKVRLAVEFPDSPMQEFSGEVVFINPEADPVNGQIRIWAEIENRDRLLRPGQRGRLTIVPNRNPDQTTTR